MPRQPSKSSRKPSVGTSRIEWIAAGLGGAILVSTIGYMVYYGLTTENGPPVVAIEQGPVERAGAGYLVRFTARNDGQSTAAELHLSGTLRNGDAVVERSGAVIDFLPEGSTREGGLFFTHDPSGLALELRAEGYVAP